jgi:hypothetical protein
MANTNQDNIAHLIDHIMLNRAQWKEVYIAAYLSATGYTMEEVELVEQQRFDNALNTVIISYYLQRKHP